VEQHAEVLIGGPWHQRIPTWRDAVATLLVLAIVILLGLGTHQMMGPFVTAQQPRISLSPTALRLMPCTRRCACWPHSLPP